MSALTASTSHQHHPSWQAVTECTKSWAATLRRNTYSSYSPYDHSIDLQLVLGTWAATGGGIYLATRKKEEKKLNEGPAIAPTTADPEEAKFIEYLLYLVSGLMG